MRQASFLFKLLFSLIIISSLPVTAQILFAHGNYQFEKVEPVVQGQIAESFSVTRVDDAHQQLKADGKGVGILVIDDWNSLFPGAPHGESVFEIVRATAPDADIWLCKLDFSVAIISDFTGCLDEIEAKKLPVKVVNMSFSMGDKLYANHCGTDLTEFGRAIHRLSQQGILFVSSAGNQGSKGSLRFPACHEDVISVGATYDFDGSQLNFESDDFSCSDTPKMDSITCYSNVAKYLDLLAPGTTVSTSVNPRFGGTSASAPLVTGIIAMMLSKNPKLTRAELIQTLQDTGQSIYEKNLRKSFSRVDAYSAIQAISPESALGSRLVAPAASQQDVSGFDLNHNALIEDGEFFKAVDKWIGRQINDTLFFQVLDAWTSQVAVQSNESDHGNKKPFRLSYSGRSVQFAAGVDTDRMSLEIYDSNGRKIYADQSSCAELRWNFQSSGGRVVANGVYLYVLGLERDGRVVQHTGKVAVLH
ncbi:S8 family serine peptidase [Candidatus Acetothermia bacterium]|nr:S8 family serine peptidase [Candidatus Acetothermia bacterium]